MADECEALWIGDCNNNKTPDYCDIVSGTSLDEIVQAVNRVGAAPGDLVAILEALKQAGALRAELVVI